VLRSELERNKVAGVEICIDEVIAAKFRYSPMAQIGTMNGLFKTDLIR
jgi:hypothetical protein